MRFILLLCAFLLSVITGMRAQVTTQEDFVTACAKANSGDVITLGSGEFAIGPVDINGKTLTFKGQGASVTKIYIGNGSYDGNGGHGSSKTANMTFEDLALDDLSSDAGYLTGFTEAAGLTFRNVTFNVGFSNWGNKGGDVSFYNCTFYQHASDRYCVQELRSGNNTKFLFDGCTFYCTGEGRFINAYKQGGASTAIEITCKNCTFDNSEGSSKYGALYLKDDYSDGCNLILTFVGTNATIGNFPENPSALFATKSKGHATVYLKDNDDAEPVKIFENNAKTESWVDPNGYVPAPAGPAGVAQIGSTTYATLADAVNAATTGQTITLLADVADAGSLSLKADVTLDGANHKISGNSAIYINAAGGSVRDVNFENIHNSNNTLSAVYASSLTGALSITDCSFDNVDWDAIQITPLEGASITITGNTFTHTGTENCIQKRYIHIQHTATAIPINAALTIQNNRFYKTKDTSAKAITTVGIWTVDVLGNNVNLTDNYFEYEGNILYTNAEVTRDASLNTYCDKLFPAIGNDNNALNPVQVVGNIAYLTQDVAYAVKFNNTYKYYTLADLIEAGKTTAILLRDVNENVTLPEGKSLNIQHGTFKLEGTIINNGTLNLYINSPDAPVSTATITNNGTVIMNCNAATGYTINGGKVEITKGGTYDLSKIMNAESIVISGGTFTTKPDDSMLKEWYVAVKNSNGTYTVRKMNEEEAIAAGAIAYGASYGSATNYYKTLENIAENTVVLMKDAIGYELSSVNYIFLNTNGHTFRGSINTPGHYTRIDKSFGVEVTDVTGKELNIGAYNEAASATIKNAHDLTTLQVNAKGACTIEGGNYNDVKVQWRYENGEIIKGSLTIKGGTFKSNTVTIATSGKPNTEPAPEPQPLSDYVAEGYELISNTDPATKDAYPYMVAPIKVRLEVHDDVEVTTNEATTEDVVEAAKAAVEKLSDNENVTAGDATNIAEMEDVHSLVITVVSASVETEKVDEDVSATITQVTYDVQPYKNEEKVNETAQPLTFRLPVPVNFTGAVKVSHKHNGAIVATTYENIQGVGANKYVTLSSDKFSEWTLEYVNPNIELTVFAGNSTSQTMKIHNFVETQKTYPNAMAVVSSAHASEVEGLTNVIVDYTVGKSSHYYECENFVLTDLKDWYSPVDFKALNASYSRANVNDGSSVEAYNTVCFPFAINGGNVNGQIYTFSNYDGGNNVYFTPRSYVDAGTPCIVRTNGSSAWNFTLENVDVKATPNTSTNMQGSYTKVGVYDEKNYKFINNGVNLGKTTSGSTCSPFRAYIVLDMSLGVSTESNKFNIVIADEDDLTAIMGNTVNKTHDVIFRDLNGNVIANPIKGQIYIIGGQKVRY